MCFVYIPLIHHESWQGASNFALLLSRSSGKFQHCFTLRAVQFERSDPAVLCGAQMIGGNAYFGQRPSHELMVRWTQVNALMPAMQFSIAPWDLSPETARLCAAALELRKKVGLKQNVQA